MADGYYHISVVYDSLSETLVENVVEVCSDCGFVDEGSLADQMNSLDIDNSSPSGTEKLDLSYSGFDLELRFDFQEADDWWATGTVTFAIQARYLELPQSDVDSGRIENLRAGLVGAVKQITKATDPAYAYSVGTQTDSNDFHSGVVPVDRPIADHLEHIPWIGVYHPTTVEAFGGYEYVLDAPADHVERLASGHVLIVATESPLETPNDMLESHLLDNENDSSPTTKQRSRELADPFAALARGNHGADVCLHRDDISESFPNEGIELVRVYVDKDRNLRRVSDDSFVRNVVDADLGDDIEYIQGMLADVPATATDEDLMVSTLLQGVIPPSFVRLDGPDDENVVTRVMELNTTVSKHELLVSLGRVAQQDDFTDEDLQTMEGALDNLADVENADAIDEYIRQNLL